MSEYEEISDAPVIYETSYGQSVNAIVVYCSYGFGITIIKDAAHYDYTPENVYLLCLNRKGTSNQFAVKEYDRIFDYIYNRIRINEVIQESVIYNLSSFISERTSAYMAKICPFNQ